GLAGGEKRRLRRDPARPVGDGGRPAVAPGAPTMVAPVASRAPARPRLPPLPRRDHVGRCPASTGPRRPRRLPPVVQEHARRPALTSVVMCVPPEAAAGARSRRPARSARPVERASRAARPGGEGSTVRPALVHTDRLDPPCGGTPST